LFICANLWLSFQFVSAVPSVSGATTTVVLTRPDNTQEGSGAGAMVLNPHLHLPDGLCDGYKFHTHP
jgi:hypothetical protein